MDYKPIWRTSSPLLLLLLAIVFSFFYNLNGAPLFDYDEGVFSEATREMFERGDFISTYLNGNPLYDKPILTYWLQAIGVLIFGIHELAFRLPSAVAAACWVFAVYVFVNERVDKQTGWVAAMMTTTALWVSIIGRVATADALANLFIALSLFDMYRYFQDNNTLYRNRAFLWAGLGFLTKGPIGILIPFIVSLLFFTLQKQWRRWLKAIFHPLGIVIFLAVALPWYIAQYLKEGQPFIEEFFLKHNVGRYLASMEGHSGGFYYYIPAVFLIVLPYSSLLVRISGRLPEIRKKPFDLFLWLWFFFVLVFFSFSATKLPHYVLHGCTPLFILMAQYRNDLRSRFLALLPALAFLTVVLFLPEIVEQVRAHISDAYIKALLSEADTVFGIRYRLWMAMALVVVAVLPFVKKLAPWQSLIFAGLVNVFIIGHLLFPLAGTIHQGPVKEAALKARQEGYYVVMWGIDTPSFSVYREQVTPRRKPRSGEVVFTREDRLEQLGPYQLLYQKGGVTLALVEGRYD
jgi:4-amino-4-deoxy-L-arabinose transferase-like glycosyltransferase